MKETSLNKNPATLAVVGTWEPSAYGKNAAEKLTRDLVPRGISIVSGMARGIDTIAHKSVLEEKSQTIAVLVCGLTDTYPSDNFGLRKRIAETEAIVSEFPMTQKPDKYNFPARMSFRPRSSEIFLGYRGISCRQRVK